MSMETGILLAIDALEKENANLQPELMTAEGARWLLCAYARADKRVSFGIAALSRKLDDSLDLARLTGSSVAKAKLVAFAQEQPFHVLKETAVAAFAQCSITSSRASPGALPPATT